MRKLVPIRLPLRIEPLETLPPGEAGAALVDGAGAPVARHAGPVAAFDAERVFRRLDDERERLLRALDRAAAALRTEAAREPALLPSSARDPNATTPPTPGRWPLVVGSLSASFAVALLLAGRVDAVPALIIVGTLVAATLLRLECDRADHPGARGAAVTAGAERAVAGTPFRTTAPLLALDPAAGRAVLAIGIAGSEVCIHLPIDRLDDHATRSLAREAHRLARAFRQQRHEHAQRAAKYTELRLLDHTRRTLEHPCAD